MNCQCKKAGFCKTHNRPMSEKRFGQCQSEPGYFEMFQRDAKQRLRSREKQSKGVGDHVETAIKATGLNVFVKMYEKLTGKPCGCKKRKEWLNRFSPFIFLRRK